MALVFNPDAPRFQQVAQKMMSTEFTKVWPQLLATIAALVAIGVIGDALWNPFLLTQAAVVVAVMGVLRHSSARANTVISSDPGLQETKELVRSAGGALPYQTTVRPHLEAITWTARQLERIETNVDELGGDNGVLVAARRCAWAAASRRHQVIHSTGDERELHVTAASRLERELLRLGVASAAAVKAARDAELREAPDQHTRSEWVAITQAEQAAETLANLHAAHLELNPAGYLQVATQTS